MMSMARRDAAEPVVGYAEFVPVNDSLRIDAVVNGQNFEFGLLPQRGSVRQLSVAPSERAKISLEADSHRIVITIAFPESMHVERVSSKPQALEGASAPQLAPAARSAGAERARQEEQDESSSELTSSDEEDEDEEQPYRRTETQQELELQRERMGQPAAQSAAAMVAPVAAAPPAAPPRPPTPPAARQSVEPIAAHAVQPAVAAPAPAAVPAQAEAGASRSEYDENALRAIHRVSEDDARIKGRRQQERIDQVMAKRTAHPSAMKEGVELEQRRSIDRGQPDRNRAASIESDRLDDVEYTKDEELERVKKFFRKVFHKEKKAPKTASAVQGQRENPP